MKTNFVKAAILAASLLVQAGAQANPLGMAARRLAPVKNAFSRMAKADVQTQEKYLAAGIVTLGAGYAHYTVKDKLAKANREIAELKQECASKAQEKAQCGADAQELRDKVKNFEWMYKVAFYETKYRPMEEQLAASTREAVAFFEAVNGPKEEYDGASVNGRRVKDFPLYEAWRRTYPGSSY